MSHFALDNTLKVLHNTLQVVKGALLMAIEFNYRGKKWRADTPEEAVKLREFLEKEDRDAVDGDIEAEEELIYAQTSWTPDRFNDLIKNIGPMQQRFLAVLFTSHSVAAETARKKLKLPTLLSLAGVQSGLAKQVHAMGLEPSDLYNVRISWTDGERKRFFSLAKGFRLVAEDVNWPPEKIRDEVK